MAMQHLARTILIVFLGVALAGGLRAMEGLPPSVKQAEYRQSDTNFYPRADIVEAHPSAVIVPEANFTRTSDSYLFPTHDKAPKEVWVETVHDWIEPITPPGGGAALPMPPDAMQIREPQGDVQAALPSAPASFAPVTDGMTLPNGAVLKTGANATVAVLFGGVDSARLIPNSEAAVQQTVTAQTRSAEVDLTAGGVFSKVGTQVGVKGEYEVHTPNGNAEAQGGDFVTLDDDAQTPHTDVWVEQGAVNLVEPDGARIGQASADGRGPLHVLRTDSVSAPDPALDAQELTEILNFIPLANQKIKALREKRASGVALTAPEQDYLDRIREVPSLIKLTLASPSKPAATASSSSSASPAGAAALRVVVRLDGKVNFQGVTLDLAEFQSRLDAIVKATPDQAIVIRAGKKVAYDKFKAVLDVCHAALVTNLSVVAAPTPSPSSTTSASSAAAPAPVPGLIVHPSMEPSSLPPAETPSTSNPPASAGP
jgi:biopolymer transport protein ExbD